jgi:Na+-translocating ferredoxin:NAD+ oxidoreductase subunit B
MNAQEAYHKIAENMRYPESKELMELLQYILSPVQALIVISLPSSHQNLADKLGISLGEVDKNIRDLADRGIIFPKDFSTMQGARFARSLPQLHDAMLSDSRWDPKKCPELAQKWQKFYESGYDRDHAMWFLQTPIPTQRILPAIKSLDENAPLQPWEDVREIVKAAQLIAVVSCSCRSRKMGVGEECKFGKRESCMQFGRGAEYAIKRGSGRKVSKEEAFSILIRAEEEGLVHQAWNAQKMEAAFLCNCCPDCCVDWVNFKRYKIPTSGRWQRSRWNAYVDEENCNGCALCQDICGFGAIAIKNDKAVIDEEKCFGCGVCVIKCAPKAITMKLLRTPEFIPKEGLDYSSLGFSLSGGVYKEGPKLP